MRVVTKIIPAAICLCLIVSLTAAAGGSGIQLLFIDDIVRWKDLND